MAHSVNSTQKRILRLKVYARDGGRCRLCFQPVAFDSMTLDHIIPKSKGGGFDFGNVRLAHKECNSGRGSAATKQSPARLGIQEGRA